MIDLLLISSGVKVFLIIAAFVILIAVIIYLVLRNARKSPPRHNDPIEVDARQIALLADYAAQKKREDELKQAQAIEALKIKQERKDLLKEQLETFKQTKEQLRDKLKGQLDAKEWKPLEAVLRSADKGGVGVYVLYNPAKKKYYVGQAKQIFKRVRDHFKVEDITRDYIAGDEILVKYLTANELDNDYRLDHIEKTGIELFDADKSGYNKTEGNV